MSLENLHALHPIAPLHRAGSRSRHELTAQGRGRGPWAARQQVQARGPPGHLREPRGMRRGMEWEGAG